jgi:hypothetical protein
MSKRTIAVRLRRLAGVVLALAGVGLFLIVGLEPSMSPSSGAPAEALAVGVLCIAIGLSIRSE